MLDRMPALHNRLRSANWLYWTVVLGTFGLGYAAYVVRRPFFSPDSRYYLAMAYLFGGEDPESARDLTAEFAAHYGVPVPPADELFGWGLVQPRVILPLLAAPLVRAFGPFGLAATTLILTVILVIALAVILLRRFGPGPALTVMVILNTSHFLMIFHGGMLTESLSALWTVGTLASAWWWLRDGRWWQMALVSVTVIGAAFTRQATSIVAGAFVMAWLLGLIIRRMGQWMWPALVASVTAIACQLLQSAVFPSFSQLDQFLAKTGTDSLGAALLETPRMAATILSRDAATFLREDVALLVLIVLSVAGMLYFWRRTEAHLLFGAILGVALYNVTNGTPTQFRYAVPGLVFFALCAALLVRRATSSSRVTGKVTSERSAE